MHTLLTLTSSLVFFVLAASVVAFVPALITWQVLRWSTRCPVPFNRAYYACLVWIFAASAVGLVLLLAAGGHAVAMTTSLASPWMRAALLLGLLIGVLALWRMVPRGDGHRISLGNACMAAALGAAPVLAVLAAWHH